MIQLLLLIFNLILQGFGGGFLVKGGGGRKCLLAIAQEFFQATTQKLLEEA